MVLLLLALGSGGAIAEEPALQKVEPLVLKELAASGQTDFFLWLAEKAD